MGSLVDHVALANRNHEMLAHLLESCDRFPEWVATVAFYKAVHVVEAVFAKEGVHSADHTERSRKLKENRFKHIFMNYRPLLDVSKVARYLQDSSGSQFTTFANYLAPEQVKRTIVFHRLHQVEESACRLLGKDGSGLRLVASLNQASAASKAATATAAKPLDLSQGT